MDVLIEIYYLGGFLMFFTALWGIVVCAKNLFIILIELEVMLLSVIIIFLSFSAYLDDMVGQLFCLFILVVAASETAVGLALIIALFKLRKNIDTSIGVALRG
jgi:NADH-quinone oxidoreductase subunit K